MDAPEIHYHVMVIIPFNTDEEEKKAVMPSYHPMMFITESTTYRGLFAYENAYRACKTHAYTLVGCYDRSCK